MNSTKVIAVIFFILAAAGALFMLYQVLSIAQGRDGSLTSIVAMLYEGSLFFSVGAVLWALDEIVDRLPPS